MSVFVGGLGGHFFLVLACSSFERQGEVMVFCAFVEWQFFGSLRRCGCRDVLRLDGFGVLG